MIRNIIFDIGKVLVSYEPDAYMDRLGLDEKAKAAINQAMFQNKLWVESDQGLGTPEWILDLKARGYHVYIISNYAENMYNQTKDKLAFLPLMDDVVMSYTIKKMKPDPAIYNYLCDENWLEPEESVFIDDRQENVNGAEAVGIHGILFKDYETAKQELNKFLRDSNILCKNFPNEG